MPLPEKVLLAPKLIAAVLAGEPPDLPLVHFLQMFKQGTFLLELLPTVSTSKVISYT